MNDLVSVIIPTYNRNKLLKRSITSVLNQSYDNIEVIVVDDYEKNNAQSVIEEISDDRVCYVKNPRKGGNAARNFGVSVSKGNFITFLDDDDEYISEKIELQMSLYTKLSNNIQYPIIYGGRIVYDKDKEYAYMPKYHGNIHRIFLIFSPASTITLFMHKTAFMSVGGFNENLIMGQEWELNIRLSKKYRYYPVTLKPIVKVYRHNENRDSILGNEYIKHKVKIKKMYKSEWDFITYTMALIRQIKIIFRKTFHIKKSM